MLKRNIGLGVEVQACNPSYSGSQGRRIMVQVPSHPGQKHETLSEKQIKVKRAVGVA
jgi:hypothetical protein